MNIVVDTSVWSLALRRGVPPQHPCVGELHELSREGRVVMLGPIRQEVLSGIRTDGQFRQLRDHLRPFPDLPLAREDYEEAARFINHCRARGVQASNTDFLLCAAASRRKLGILAVDRDFEMLAPHLPIALHRPRA